MGHYSDTNSASAGLHGVLMDSDDEDAESLADEEYLEEVSNELAQLKEDREDIMCGFFLFLFASFTHAILLSPRDTASYAFEQGDPLDGMEGYVFKEEYLWS